MNTLFKTVKLLPLLFLALFLTSCDKDDPEAEPKPEPEQSGFLKNHFSTIADLRIEKTTGSSFSYVEGPTSRGYTFKPLKDIKMTSVGAMIAEKGTYKVSLTNSVMRIEQFIDSLVISDTEKFTYKKLQKPIVLKADSTYTISYFAQNHGAVYDAKSPKLQLPFTTSDIEIIYNYYVYYYWYPHLNRYEPGTIGGFQGFTMRGLVDFIYEEI